MSYNDGHVHLDFYGQTEKYDEIAEDFSEGDPLLKDVLLGLWAKGVKTNACCKGHKGEASYLALIIDDKSKDVIQSTCEYLYEQDGNMMINFCNNEKEYSTFYVHILGEEDKNNYLSFLQTVLSQQEENKKPKNNIPLYADRLLACAKRMKTTCRYVITKEQMVFGFFEGENDLAPGKVYDLNAFLKKIEEKRGVPFIPFACDAKSLEQFINIVYPGTFKNSMSNVI